MKTVKGLEFKRITVRPVGLRKSIVSIKYEVDGVPFVKNFDASDHKDAAKAVASIEADHEKTKAGAK